MRTKLYGTAAALHQVRLVNEIREEIGREGAIRLMTAAMQKYQSRITSADVAGLMRCTEALWSGQVDVQAEYSRQKRKATEAAEVLLGRTRRRAQMMEDETAD